MRHRFGLVIISIISTMDSEITMLYHPLMCLKRNPEMSAYVWFLGDSSLFLSLFSLQLLHMTVVLLVEPAAHTDKTLARGDHGKVEHHLLLWYFCLKVDMKSQFTPFISCFISCSTHEIHHYRHKTGCEYCFMLPFKGKSM